MEDYYYYYFPEVQRKNLDISIWRKENPLKLINFLSHATHISITDDPNHKRDCQLKSIKFFFMNLNQLIGLNLTFLLKTKGLLRRSIRMKIFRIEIFE